VTPSTSAATSGRSRRPPADPAADPHPLHVKLCVVRNINGSTERSKVDPSYHSSLQGLLTAGAVSKLVTADVLGGHLLGASYRMVRHLATCAQRRPLGVYLDGKSHTHRRESLKLRKAEGSFVPNELRKGIGVTTEPLSN
jgi:hypothetical protein